MSKNRGYGTSAWWNAQFERRAVLKGMGVAGGVALVGRASAINEILPSFGSEQVLTTADNEGSCRSSSRTA